MEKIHEFISDLLVRRGITDLPDDIREQTIDEMTDLLLDEIDNAAIDALPEDKAIELADKLDDESFDDEKVAQFMQDSGIDLQRIALETMLQFRMLYLGEAEAPKAEESAEAAE